MKVTKQTTLVDTYEISEADILAFLEMSRGEPGIKGIDVSVRVRYETHARERVQMSDLCGNCITVQVTREIE